MGFLQEFVSVLPSIASVIAPLFGANKNDYLKYALHNGESVYFKKDENGEICCCNPFREPISLVFPDKNGVGGESVSIDRSSSFPVTQMLTERAKVYIDDFQIEKGGISAEKNQLGEPQMATISASGKVPNRNDTTKIGTSLFVKINGDDLAIQINPLYKLEGILSLEVSGDGNEPCLLFKNEENNGSTPAPVMKGEPSTIEMNFPGALSTFKDSNNVFVSAVARCSYGANGEMPDELKCRGRQMTESDWEFLRIGRCLNG